jgi:RNA polymerase sigma factor (sigma-70 family)
VEQFDKQAMAAIRRLDRGNCSIRFEFQRVDPFGGTKLTSNLLSFYRQEVQRIPSMDRKEETRFCMGVELLWRRLKVARRAAGFRKEDIEKFPGTSDLDCLTCPEGREQFCQGCAPQGLKPELRKRLRARHQEFEAARNELIARNLFLVFRLLNRYRKVAVSEEDLIQEANFSLFKAVEGFDFRRGIRFKTYAGYWVNQAFLNAIYNQSRVVRVPAYIQKAMKKINDVVGDREGLLFDIPQLSQKTGVKEDLVRSVISGNRFTQSLDRLVDAESGAKLMDMFSGQDMAENPEFGERHSLDIHLNSALNGLTAREQLVLKHRFGLRGAQPETLSDVGKRLGVSLERVRQLQKAALGKIREGSTAPLLEQFA